MSLGREGLGYSPELTWDDNVTQRTFVVMPMSALRSILARGQRLCSPHGRQPMDKTRHIKLAVLFGAFTALVAVVVQLGALALMRSCAPP